MYITHSHPMGFTEEQQRLDNLAALHRSCLLAIQRHRHTSPPVAPGSARDR